MPYSCPELGGWWCGWVGLGNLEVELEQSGGVRRALGAGEKDIEVGQLVTVGVCRKEVVGR